MHCAFLVNLASQAPVVLLPALAQVNLLDAGGSQIFQQPVSSDPAEKRPKSG